MSLPSGNRGVQALFVSYDGLTDPLGGSQILPYLRGIADSGHGVKVVSFEKPERYQRGGATVRRQLEERKMAWFPLRFTRRPKYLAKLWDLSRILLFTLWHARDVDVIHCRSYIACQAGLFAKRFTGAKLIFDMRGFWVDERIDGGIWQLSKPFDRLLYGIYKRIEKKLLSRSDHVILLSEAAAPVVRAWAQSATLPYTVIPCCADFEHFTLGTEAERTRVRATLEIESDALVLCYLGSLGSWYLFPEMLQFFACVRRAQPRARFLIVTQDWSEENEAICRANGFDDEESRSRILVIGATRDEVPALLQAADLGLSFIKPAFSKTASSATKMAEMMAVGLPVICNAGIGDVEQQIRDLKAGWLLHDFSSESFGRAVESLDKVLALGGRGLRERAKCSLSLELASQRYANVYKEIETQRSR